MIWVIKEAKKALKELYPDSNPEFMTPPRPEMGDLSTNLPFMLAKSLKKNPAEISREIADSIKLPKVFERVEASSGYLNFFVNWEAVVEELEKSPGLAWEIPRRDGRVIIEFPSVNPGKPWHVGHGRNAVLGDTLSRMFRFAGYDVIRQDYIDDLGLQVAQVLWGVMNLKDLPERKGLLEKEDQWQGRVYVKVASMKESIEEEIRDIMKKMEEGDESIKGIHEEIVDKCLRAQYETAFRLGIYHDVKIHESHIVHSGLFEKGFEMIKKSGHVVLEKEGKNKGCWVAKLSHLKDFQGMKDADKILIRSDGTATYTGKDVVYQMWKFGIIEDPMRYVKWLKQPNGEDMWSSSLEGESMKFNGADIVINVIGSEQTYPQKVVYWILKLMGYEREFQNSFHLAYEHVWFKEKGEAYKFSGRKGTWIGYSVDEIVDRIKAMALERMKGREIRNPEEVAEMIAVGAFRYSMLSTDWSKKVAFDFEEVLSFEGNTAPYLQYSLVRAKKILEKSDTKPKPNRKPEGKEIEVLRKIVKTASIIESSLKEKKPHFLANHAFRLAEAFNSFYQSERVIGSDREEFRLWLTGMFIKTMETILDLLGIPVPDEM